MNPSSWRHIPLLIRAALAAFVLLTPITSSAQWASQTITLRPGWNAVFLEVQPQPQECDAVFATMPEVESVWRYNRKQRAVQFIENPSQLLPNAPNWLTWLPASHPLGAQSTLFILEGGLPYLIKVADTAVTANWKVQGRPVIRPPDWLENSHNFVGFCLPTNSPPTFQTFLTNSAALLTDRIYRLNSSGLWVRLVNPATTPMQRGESLWIQSAGLPDYRGPLEVQLNRRVGIEFGRALLEETFRVRNPSTNLTRTVFVRQLPSEAPPPGQPTLAGTVPLSLWRDDVASKTSFWTNFPSQLALAIPPGGSVEVRIDVRRRDMVAPPPGVSKTLYQSLLEVTDSDGTSRTLIPVSSEGAGWVVTGAPRSGGGGAEPSEANLYAGLWIGTASITDVSRTGHPEALKPVVAPFPIRILMHVGADGSVQFLQKVIQMWSPGTYKPAGDGTTNRVPDKRGRFELYTDESLLAEDTNLTGAALVNGKTVPRRFSTVAFGFPAPIPMTGTFGGNGNGLICDVLVDYDDPRNPFRHAFHPDHDNKDDRTGPDGQLLPLPVSTNAAGLRYTAESSGVNRNITLTFQNQNVSGADDKRVGGVYTETMTGLHSAEISVSGTFTLQYAGDDPTLDQSRL